MMTHKKRLIGLVLFALIEVAVLLLPAFDVIDADTAELGAKTLLGLMTALGLIDAAMVERRRRNPSVPAIVDDVRDARQHRRPGTLVEPYPPLPAPPPDPPSSALALLLIVLACSSPLLSACGAGALQVHVEVAAGFEDSAREAALVVRTYRTESMRAAARAVHDAGGTEAEAIAAARAAAERVQPLVEGQRVYALATHAYVDALWLAEHSREGFTISAIMPALRDLLDAYRHVRELGEALGVEQLAGLPDTPAFLDGAVPPQLLASARSQEGGAR